MQQWHNKLASTLSLDGLWEFSIGDQMGSIRVPGTWEAQSYQHGIDGPAMYKTQVHVPASWAGQIIQIQFDAVSYQVEITINGVCIGSHAGLWTAFAFDVTDAIQAGADNQIQLLIYKPGTKYAMRESLAGFLPDVCLPFGGVWQSARLVTFPTAAISNISIISDAAAKTVSIGMISHQAKGMHVAIRLHGPGDRAAATWRSVVTTNEIMAQITLDEVQWWSLEQPALYQVEISLTDANGHEAAHLRRSFGFRALTRDGDQLLFNGTAIFLRGVLNWGWYPDIFCPAPDETTIRDEFRRVRELGYNMVKLCLHVPSPLYFEIADQEGMLLWLELPLWLPRVTERLRQQAPEEYADILTSVHQHPSVIIYSLGCELNASVDGELLGKLNRILRQQTAGVLVCDNSGSGEAYGGLAFDYADFNDYHFYADLHYFNPLLDHFRRDWQPARPWIFGEFCDADDFRDLHEIAHAYDGNLPWWYLEQNPIHALTAIAYSQQISRMPGLDIPFDGQALQQISRQQSFVIRKTILEKVRAIASIGGYVVTGIRDTPLATSAMFDDMGRTKYDAATFREFNGDAVLILEQGRRRTWKHGGDRPSVVDRNNHVAGSMLDFRVVLSQSNGALAAEEMRWKLTDSTNGIVYSGTDHFPAKMPRHVPTELASITFGAPEHDRAQQYTLTVELDSGISNHWPLWVFPALPDWPDAIAIYDPSGSMVYLDDLYQRALRINHPAEADRNGRRLIITSAFTTDIHAFVRGGGCAIVLQNSNGSLPVRACPFWREAINLIHTHPVLENFPHNGHVDLQFYHLATDYALDRDALLSRITHIQQMRPIIQRLDARQFTLLDYLIEGRLGTGWLLASTLRMGGGAGDQVDGLQRNIAGRYLLYAMVGYLLNQHALG